MYIFSFHHEKLLNIRRMRNIYLVIFIFGAFFTVFCEICLSMNTSNLQAIDYENSSYS